MSNSFPVSTNNLNQFQKIQFGANTVESLKTNINNTLYAAADKSVVSKNYKAVPLDPDALGLGKFIQLAKAEDGNGVGSLAEIFKPKGNGLVNILKDFPWTISSVKDREDVPYIELKEHIVEGGNVQKQFEFYTKGFVEASRNFFGGGKDIQNTLQVYDEIFIRNESGWSYKFPYFSKIQYELATAAWEKFDKIGESVSGLAGGMSSMLNAIGFKGTASIVDTMGKAFTAAATTAETIAKFKYPIVDVADRPRLFTSHSERSVTIEFPLFNTVKEMDWVMNREFLTLFQSQNLFNKRNFATGLPPVWYEVYVPNQYYSVASCVTNIKVENLGNIRKEMRGGKDIIVPDAYQVQITLQEMAMPSKNQFHSALGRAHPFRRVNASTQQTSSETTTTAPRTAETQTAALGVMRPFRQEQ